jgi:hypothetical protein
MVHQQVVTIHGSGLGDSVLQEPVVNELKALLQGPLLFPGDAGYNGARQVWNGMIDRRPALIARRHGVAIPSTSLARTSFW